MNREVKLEAFRLAKAIVREAIKHQGFKLGHFRAREITDRAKVLLNNNPGLFEIAEKHMGRYNELAKKFVGRITP